MKAAPFIHYAPTTLGDAVALLDHVARDDGRVLSGGQSLVPAMAFRIARPAHLVDIGGVKELERLAVDDGSLVVGACVRHAAFHKWPLANPLGALLAAVVPHIAHYPIRVRGTSCGSLAHADPASEWCLVAATLGAQMVAASTGGRRTIAADAFFTGMMATDLRDNEILIEARLPLLAADARFGFCEFSRRAGDYALAMALTTWRLVDGVMVEPRLGLGGVEDRPRRIAQAEAVLAGAAPGEKVFHAAAEAAADMVDPLEDVQADAAYRRDLVRAVTHRCLEQSFQ